MKKRRPTPPEKRDKPQPDKLRILIVDDHPVFRQGLLKTINSESDLSVCFEADNMPMAIEAVRRCNPDLVTVDISLKGNSGLELIKAIKAEKPALPILTISMHDESLYAVRALRAGAAGYIMKQEPMETVVRALHEVLEGKMFVSSNLNAWILSEFINQANVCDGGIENRLSDRELEVFEHIGRDKTLREIARELNLSIKTLETHQLHIKEKLDIATAGELRKLARSWLQNEEQ